MADVPEDARLDRIIERMEQAGGINCADLRPGDKLLIIVEGGQKIDIEIAEVSSGTVSVSSQGPWAIWLHLTSDWGVAMSASGGARKAHRLCSGLRMYIGVWDTPPVTHIILNGFNMTAPSAKQKN